MWAPVVLLICLADAPCFAQVVKPEASDLFKASKASCETHASGKVLRVMQENDMDVVSVSAVCTKQKGV